MPKLILIIAMEDSRKVGFGVWLLVLSTVLLFKKLIGADDWMICMALSSTLVGGGTVADSWLKIKGQKNVDDTLKS